MSLPAGDFRPLVDLFRNKALGVAWVMAALAGAICISLTESIQPSRLLAPVAVMAIYGIYSYNVLQTMAKRAGLSDAYKRNVAAQIADSLYFIGFLWTLWALIDSFLLKTTNEPTAVFRTFAYALVTTALGMFCRLTILQFRYTAVDQASSAQETIEELLNKFAVAVGLAENSIVRFRSELVAAQVVIKDASEASRDALLALPATIEAVQTAAVSAVQVVSAESIKESRAAITATAAALREELGKAINGIVGKLTDGLASETKSLKENVADVSRSLKRSAASVQKGSDQVDKALDDLASGIGTGSSEITESTKAIAADIKHWTPELEKILALAAEKIESAGVELEKTAKGGAEDARAFRKEYDTRLIKLAESMQTASEDITKSAKEFKAEFEAKLKNVTDSVREVLEADKVQHEQLNNAIRALADSLSVLDKNVTTLAKKLDRNEEASAPVAPKSNGKGPWSFFRKPE
jgi:hypothetical protein